MAFFNKASNILKQTVSRQMNSEVCGSGPSVFQVIRSMSSSKLFVGGLSYSSDEPSLKEAFSKYGEVVEARIISDRETGRSKGFGFITFASVEEASAAIQAMDQQELHGRRIGVNYAQERAPRTGGYGGGYGGGFGGSGGGSYGSYGGQGGGFQSETSGGNNFGNDGGNSNYAGGNDFGSSDSFGQDDTTKGNYGNDDGEYADRRV